MDWAGELTTRLTILELIATVQDTARSDEEAVAIMAHLIDTGRVVISGGSAKRIAAALAM